MKIFLEQKINFRKSHPCSKNVLNDYEIKLQEWYPKFFF